MRSGDWVWVVKKDVTGRESWRYRGQVVERFVQGVLIEAFFDRAEMPFFGIVLRPGDRFLEAYFSDRWYNLFEIYDRDTNALKAWYANITRPAEISTETITYVDLALDLLIYPDGRQKVLDEAEFATLPLTPDERLHALAALGELQGLWATPDATVRWQGLRRLFFLL
jgi:predicted RNA-binding protein associated with RNAse of E/G family